MKNEETGGSNSLKMFLFGGLVGAAAAILLAPKSGKETRQDIKDFANDVRCRVQGYVGDVADRISGGVEKGKQVISDRKGMIKSALDAGKEAYAREKERIEKGDGQEEESPGEQTS